MTNTHPAQTDTGCLNLRWSLALIDGLIEGGVRHLVLSPGSRSTPLVLAAQRRPTLRITPILDERSAAFFALGLARASARPVAVLATSGSAPAHWYPAVIEAAAWGLPLVLLSADRPPTLRHWGANQTIDQTRLFGEFVVEFHDPGPPENRPDSLKTLHALGRRAAVVSQGRSAPVHLNLPFHEPLTPGDDCVDVLPPAAREQTLTAGIAPPPWQPRASNAQDGLPPGRGLILCGPATVATPAEADDIRQCAQALGLPLLADPLSGVRFNRTIQTTDPDIRHYDAILRNPVAARRLRPDWVLRFGLAPVSKRLGEWLNGAPAWLADQGGQWVDPSHDALGLIRLKDCCRLPNRLGGWLEPWQQADRAAARLTRDALAASNWHEGPLIDQLLARIPANEGLFCANSMPIRQLDTWSGGRRDPLSVFGNRGVSGIDGQLSTLAGLNSGGIPTWGLIGDLSFCHDLSGLLLTPHMQRPIIVINNGGGRIFDYLPQHGLPDFERYWRTPVTPNLHDLVKPFGLPCVIIENASDFAKALELPPGPRLLEVRIDAEVSRKHHLIFWQHAAQAELFAEASI